MKKKMLITGGSHAEVPLIRAAQKLGWYVISTGTNKDGIGHKYADEYVYGDFSDKEFIVGLAKEKGVSSIVSGCNDFAYLSTSYACERLHLPGHDTYDISCKIHHKDSFREECRLLGIRTPKSITCYSVDEAIMGGKIIGYPVIVKPIDLTGGKGVRKCYDDDDVREAFSVAISQTCETKIIVEKFIVGSNHGGSFLLKKGKVVAGVIGDEQYGLNRYLVAGATIPSKIVSDVTVKLLISEIEALSKRLALVDGLFHIQFIVASDGYPYMIDPCRRSPGDLYILLSSIASGIDFPKEIIKAETGKMLCDRYEEKKRYVARECIMTKRKGCIDSIFIDESLKDRIIYGMLWYKRREYIDDPLNYKAGILILKFDTREEMDNAVLNFDNLVRINFLEDSNE